MKKNVKEVQLKIISALDAIVSENLTSKKLKKATKVFAKKLSKKIEKAEKANKKEEQKKAKKALKKLIKQDAILWNDKTESSLKTTI